MPNYMKLNEEKRIMQYYYFLSTYFEKLPALSSFKGLIWELEQKKLIDYKKMTNYERGLFARAYRRFMTDNGYIAMNHCKNGRYVFRKADV